MTEQIHQDQLQRIQELVAKTKTPEKLTFDEAKELTTLAKEFTDGGRFSGEEHLLLRIDAREALKKDGFLSQSEIDAARNTFANVLSSEPGSIGQFHEITRLETANPDARSLNREYFTALHAAEDDLKKAMTQGLTIQYPKEEHTLFGGITGYNKEVDARNKAAHDQAVEKELGKLSDAWTEARLPAFPQLLKEDQVLEATLKKLGQTGGVIDDTRSEGSTGAPAPTGQAPGDKDMIRR